MTVPAWLLDTFAAIMLLVAAVSAARLVMARRRDLDADIDVSHLLMGLAMAGTLTTSLRTLPSLAWEVIFGLLAAWFAYRVTREYRAGGGLRALAREHHAPHLLHSLAMLYMFLALRPASHAAPSGTMSGMAAAGLRLPTLALLFAFLLVAYAVADLDRLPAPRALTTPHAPHLATLLGLTTPAPSLAPGPGVARGCRVAMGVTMAFMLIIMI